jgi:hypothetical protein
MRKCNIIQLCVECGRKDKNMTCHVDLEFGRVFPGLQRTRVPLFQLVYQAPPSQ